MWGPRTLSCNIGNDALMFPQSDSIYNSGIYSQPAETCWQGPASSWLSPLTTELRQKSSRDGWDEMLDIHLSRASVGLIKGAFTLLIIAPLLMKYW